MGIIRDTVRFLRKNSTRSEQIFWGLVKGKKFHNLRFQRQYPIKYVFRNRSSFFVADFYCHKLKLIVEIDGGIHMQTREHDEIRDYIVKAYGFNIFRFTDTEVISGPTRVLQKIEHLIQLAPPLNVSSREAGVG